MSPPQFLVAAEYSDEIYRYENSARMPVKYLLRIALPRQ
jgi:hypothetical protein